ncbi:hypothetical protein CEXT_501441 [Caerostris extrusa]|uniref:Uncharacterized protein n=1 Tax=Caerostris extrusa TaxID=172846 RepID=A0AAV4RIX1_CAEEX|nr:hypothetical protein CEXT_501441 [Caerostris extrusa]
MFLFGFYTRWSLKLSISPTEAGVKLNSDIPDSRKLGLFQTRFLFLFIVGSVAMNGCNLAVRDKEWEKSPESIKRNRVLQMPATDSKLSGRSAASEWEIFSGKIAFSEWLKRL